MSGLVSVVDTVIQANWRRTKDLTEGKPLSGKMLGSAQFPKEVVLLNK